MIWSRPERGARRLKRAAARRFDPAMSNNRGMIAPIDAPRLSRCLPASKTDTRQLRAYPPDGMWTCGLGKLLMLAMFLPKFSCGQVPRLPASQAG